MLRCWLGIIFLTGFVLSADVAAQSAGGASTAGTCDVVKIRTALASKRVPDFTGCSVDYAADILRASGYFPQKNIDDQPNSAAAGIVTRQTSAKRQVNLFYSSGIARPSPPPPPPPPPPAIPAQLSIKGPLTITEGDRINLTIQRDRIDQRSQSGTLRYQPPGLMDQPPLTFSFIGKSDTAPITLVTGRGTPGDGDQVLTVIATSTNDGEVIGQPAEFQIRVIDHHPVQSYSVAVTGEQHHGAPVSFRVRRSDPADQTEPSYVIQQDGHVLRSDQRVPFDLGESMWTTQINPGEYNNCGGPVSLVLNAPGGNIHADAVLAGAVPAECRAQPPTTSTDIWPWVAAGLASVLAIAVDVVIFQKWRKAKKLARLAATITAAWSWRAPVIAPLTLGEQALRWPGATAEVHFEPGATPTPDPLPVQTDHHG